jgi:hypothetical protein
VVPMKLAATTCLIDRLPCACSVEAIATHPPYLCRDPWSTGSG